VAVADLDSPDAALGELRAGQPRKIPIPGRTPNSAAGTTWPTGYPMRWAGREGPQTGSRTRTLRATRQAASLRPSADWPDRAIVAVDLARVAAVIDRIAADVDELARARLVQDLNTAAVPPDPRAERRRRLAEPDLEFRAFRTRKGLPASSTPQLERAWDPCQAERHQRGEISQRPGYTGNPSRPR
jgi:hypothetical protein